MPDQDAMTIDERRKYLRIVRPRYKKANREGRGVLLDEMQAVTGLERKTLIRLMLGSLERQPRKRQRGRRYGADVDDALRVIAESYDYICAERLQPNLVIMAQQLAAHGELQMSPGLLEHLGQISIPTVRRILQRITQDEPHLPRRGPESANQATRDIPMRRIPWDESEPGHFEVDLVHHYGPDTSGSYVHTLQLIDVATGWSERVAVLGRGYIAMQDAFQRVLARLPFAILELHPDNGSEFFNAHLLKFWGEHVRQATLSRSRPWRKNDNRFVEQKNDSLVRAYLGKQRLDTVAQAQALNALYDKMWIHYNLFQPVMRLRGKEYQTLDDGSLRLRRRFDDARTPYARLAATPSVFSERKGALIALHSSTNPRQLRREIHADLDALFALPCATPGVTEDVLETLAVPIDAGKERAGLRLH
ncbi:MAG TPA: integrase [Anaerolineae bacterium]|nr:integrase [Anaerolineae bacterium]HOQ99360.1 integrase [Anaerolineae bacterium]HPL26797.1 integrase [Anaerolineae bacterium]